MQKKRKTKIKPKKKLDQHFLVSNYVGRKFSQLVCKYRKLIEIGAGTGFLTKHVLKCRSLELLATIEIDDDLITELWFQHTYDPRVLPLLSDALYPSLKLEYFDAAYGSIPYSITGPLLSLLAKTFRKPAVLLLQREVAQRLAANPGSSEYGRLTVLVRLVYKIKLHNVVPPTAFRPPPKVYSQIVELLPHSDIPSVSAVEKVESLTRCMFSERRKLAYKVARKCLERVGVSIDRLPVDLTSKRVYELSEDIFLALSLIGSDSSEAST